MYHDRSPVTFQSPFTYTQRTVLERVRKAMNRHASRLVTVNYGATDDGLVFAATLCLSGPTDSPLVTILTGPGIGGDGYAVLAADGSTLANGVPFHIAATVAQSAACRACDISPAALTIGPSAFGSRGRPRKSAPRLNKA